MRSGRSNFQSSDTFDQTLASFRIFQSIFTVPKLSKFSTVPQICHCSFEVTAILKHYIKASVHWILCMQQVFPICTHLVFSFKFPQCLKSRKWYNSLECYVEALHRSKFDHCSTRFSSLYLNIPTAIIFLNPWLSFFWKSQSAINFEIVTFSLSDKWKIHCSAISNYLIWNLGD